MFSDFVVVRFAFVVAVSVLFAAAFIFIKVTTSKMKDTLEDRQSKSMIGCEECV